MRSFFTLFVAIVGLSLGTFAQHPDSLSLEVKIPPLIITEYNWENSTRYVELTNVGDSTIDLSLFSFGNCYNKLSTNFHPETRYLGGVTFTKGYTFKPGETVEPGKSVFIMKVSDFGYHNKNMVKYGTHFAMYKDGSESKWSKYQNEPENMCFGFDSVGVDPDGYWLHWGSPALVLTYRYERPVYDEALDSTVMVKDSVLADVFGTSIQDDNQLGVLCPIAGVADANDGNWVVARKASVKQGTADWETGRGISSEDSEWMVVPICQTKEIAFTSVATHGDYQIEVTPSDGYSVDGTVLTVPWEARREYHIIEDGFALGDGMTWHYTRGPEAADSAYTRVREGDTLTLYAFGNELQAVHYTFKVQEATANVAVAREKVAKNYLGWYNQNSWLGITDDDPVIDTIMGLGYQTTIDTLMAYVEIPPKATSEIVFVDEDDKRVELKDGDKLKVISEDKSVSKEYYLKVEEYAPSDNVQLSAITFPDFAVDPDEYYWDWESLRMDTIPDFSPVKTNYTIMVSSTRKTVPALIAHPGSRNAKITEIRATNLDGSLAERTTTFEVTSESDTLSEVYSVVFERELDESLIQQIVGEPFVSEIVAGARTQDDYIELYNPTTQPIDMSNYFIISLKMGWDTWQQAVETAYIGETEPLNDDNRRTVVPGRFIDTTKWRNGEVGFLTIDPAINTNCEPGDVFVLGNCNPEKPNELEFIDEVDQNTHNSFIREDRNIEVDRSKGFAILKILNDSIRNGTKPLNASADDYQLVDLFQRSQESLDTIGDANGKWIFAGTTQINRAFYWRRKARVQQGNLVRAGGIHVDADSADWISRSQYSYLPGFKATDNIRSNLGTHYINPISSQYSTITSSVYKVSPGFEGDLFVKGVLASTSVSTFYGNINKADTAQTFVLISGTSTKTGDDIVAQGDSLKVISADSSNISVYAIAVEELNNDTGLYEVAGFDIKVEDTEVTGFAYDAKVADVLAGVKCNELSYINVIDVNNRLVPLHTTRYLQQLDDEENPQIETIDTKVYDGLLFEVVAENGDRKAYTLAPSSDELLVLSNYFEVVQGNHRHIQGVPGGLATQTFLSYLYATNEGTIQLFNKMHYERTDGYIKKDDYVKVTSKDGENSLNYTLFMVGEEEEVKIINNVEAIKAESLSKIYPNPASVNLTIENAPTEGTIQIISLSGNLVYSQEIPGMNFTVPVSQLDNGLYLVRLVNRDGATVHRFIKK